MNGALTVAQGGHFLQGFAAGAAGEAGDVGMREAGLYGIAGEEGRFIRAAIAGAIGGTASVLTGGKFANGAVTAAFAHLYNDESVKRSGFATADDAARAALNYTNPISIAANAEYGGLIYQDSSGFGFTGPVTNGAGATVNITAEPLPPDAIRVGDYHTHGDYSAEVDGRLIRTDKANDQFDSDNFSFADGVGSRRSALEFNMPDSQGGYRSYLGTPSGQFKLYTPHSGQVNF